MSLLLLSLKFSTYHQTPDIKLGLNSLLIHSEITKNLNRAIKSNYYQQDDFMSQF